jgi:tRNA-Thr(GGU) m(6)t(6)A37 methyltransferase TsaA
VSDEITFSAIAVVKSQFAENTPAEEMRKQVSQLVLKPEFEPGLLGLKAGSNILVLFYFHHTDPEQVSLQLHPRHDPDKAVRGVFATRSQFRPNGLGVTVARIEMIEGNVVTVNGLDALDGTPVLDIKPYTSYFDTDTDRQQLEVREVNSLLEARQAIDLIDIEVIRLLGNRAGYVRQVVNFKKSVEEVQAPDRYAEVMDRRRELAKTAGLNPDVIEAMYKLLVNEFIKEEIEIIRQRQMKLTG